MKLIILLSMAIYSLFIVRSSAAAAKETKIDFPDRTLQGELKQSCPFIIYAPEHGELKLIHDGSFITLGRNRYGTSGSWKVSSGKIILTYLNGGGDDLSLPVTRDKDGIKIDGQSKDKVTGRYKVGAGSVQGAKSGQAPASEPENDVD